MRACASRLIAARTSSAGIRAPAWASPPRLLPWSAAVLLLALVAPLAQAGIGDVDPGYGVNGRFVPPPDGSYACCLVLADGRLVYWTAEGYGRTDIDGRPDASFGSGGLQPWPQGYGSIATHERTGDGRLLVVLRRQGATGTEFAVLRLGLDGELDRDFGTDGLAVLEVPADGYRNVSATLQLDGKLLLLLEGGSRNEYWEIDSLVLVRLLADGRLDTAFGVGGSVAVPTAPIDRTDGFDGMSALADGHIVVHAYPGTYLTDSGVPMTGSGAGVTPWSIAQLLPGGGALAWLATDQGYRLAKVRADGSMDASFGSSGDGTITAPAEWSPHHVLAGLTVSRDGRYIYLSWGVYPYGSWRVSRLFANGQADTSFGELGTVDFRSASMGGTVYGLADGSTIVTAGDSAYRLLGQSASSPGVTGLIQDGRRWSEADGAVELRVFRAAGADGPIRLRYWAPSESELQQQGYQQYATPGVDFDAVDGVLDWSDGDVGDKVIRIPVHRDEFWGEGFESVHVWFEALSPGTVNAEDRVIVWIWDSTPPQTPPGGPTSGGGKSSGGGSFGASGLLLLLATALARRQRSQRTVTPIRRPSPKTRSSGRGAIG